jgi:hypothetical protein
LEKDIYQKNRFLGSQFKNNTRNVQVNLKIYASKKKVPDFYQMKKQTFTFKNVSNTLYKKY